VFAALWLLAELARGQWWTGFPWGAGGYAHVDGPLAVLARSVGVYGIGFAAAALAMVLAQGRAADLRAARWWSPALGRCARRAATTWCGPTQRRTGRWHGSPNGWRVRQPATPRSAPEAEGRSHQRSCSAGASLNW